MIPTIAQAAGAMGANREGAESLMLAAQLGHYITKLFDKRPEATLQPEYIKELVALLETRTAR